MYDYEEGMAQCQREIRRLHSVCRVKDEKIDRLSVLLYNVIVHFAEPTERLNEQLKWYEDTLGITAEELSEIGIDWFDDLKNRGD